MRTKFLDELPKVYKKREEEMLEQIRKAIATDEAVSEQFDAIVLNAKNTFNQKLEALKELHAHIKRE